ncbi:ketopantoate reductase family protein [Paenibacillus dakarensis]|uniref:ketopantoate reductase family protein n=1 Tax=Paenibacillus dakarensis TaxID=1527293 RepID=UPI0006D59AA9|nr:2-dehydropantoate 2-reductase [Paenibacillus dakarensis]
MTIHIIGAGSLGLLYGGKLAASGAKVKIWCRSEEQAEQLHVKGISVESDGKITHISSECFQSEPVSRFHELGGPEEEDFIFLMVKQAGVVEAVEGLLSPYSDIQPSLICFQNGTGHIEQVERILPGWRIYAAVTTEGAKRSGAAEVIHAGKGSTWIGQAGKMISEGKTAQASRVKHSEKALVTQMERAGFEVFLSNELDGMIFRKLLINAVINPLTALWRIPNGALLESEKRISLMKELYEEGVAVFTASGIPWEENLWDQILQVCRATSGNTSSMLKDVLEERTTEVSWINGSIVRMGESAGVPTPVHRLLWKLIEGIHV